MMVYLVPIHVSYVVHTAFRLQPVSSDILEGNWRVLEVVPSNAVLGCICRAIGFVALVFYKEDWCCGLSWQPCRNSLSAPHFQAPFLRSSQCPYQLAGWSLCTQTGLLCNEIGSRPALFPPVTNWTFKPPVSVDTTHFSGGLALKC